MFYPAYIYLEHRKCLVVGGGNVAERKVVSLLLSGARVTLLSPEATVLLKFLASIGQIVWYKRGLKTGDTYGYFLVCAATDSTTLNTAVFREAHEKHKIRLVNVVDVIPQCTFAAASVVTDGELMLSISTSGKSPAISRRIREYLEETLDVNSSLYTLGYENGKPVPIVNQGLPYPIYLLLKNRRCVVLYRKETLEIARRISLLRQSGANVVLNPDHLNDAFLIVTDNGHNVTGEIETSCMGSHAGCDSKGDSPTPLIENVQQQDAGTYFTQELVIDGNLIISIAVGDKEHADKAIRLHKKLAERFENRGYAVFIDFLGALRPIILSALPTSKKRAAFFETLIDHVGVDSAGACVSLQSGRCCLRLRRSECDRECLFNWMRHGRLDAADQLVSALLNEATAKA